MPHWKKPYLNLNNWSKIDFALSQHRQLLEISGFPCKILFRKTIADSIGNEVYPIDVMLWDEESPAPKKIIWDSSSEEYEFPDTRSIKVFLDGTELTQVYSHDNITSDSEFYVISQLNLLGVDDNVSLYLNDGLDVAGRTIEYFYDAISKGVNVTETVQPVDLPNTFRTQYVDGFTQYVNPNSVFRNVATPNTLSVSFPATPFDTVYKGQGRYEQQINTCWTVGDRLDYPLLKEFDILYRTDLDKWYEIRNYSPNYLPYNGTVILATQQFETAELSPDDPIKDFVLV